MSTEPITNETQQSPELAGTPETMISLRNLSKTFPRTSTPAVSDLSLDIPRGEIVILVGSSGSGKTTTMKMINRIIEPTSGQIILDGEDVTRSDPDKLRRRIGYVIQQIGLFPHMTIADNIATVPQLLGWDKRRTAQRVDELLSMVSMDPDQYRGRYPKELSGGQRQRIGVARALAADPDVMLMDEPFGAIDPITRDRLQNEFLRLQADVRKTIVFVTHDIDEAIKMGDRIAIMQEGGKIAQYGTPEEILTNPANDFVADFIGSGAALKRLNLSRVRDVELTQWPTVEVGSSARQARDLVRDSDKSAALVLDAQRRPHSWVNVTDLNRIGDGTIGEIGAPAGAVVEGQSTLADALNEMVTANYSVGIVVDRNGAYQGIIDIDSINESIRSMRSDVRTRQRAALPADDRLLS
ncbi:betaine/proline/choline family ABC transporter ATP-binding protein [Epidermidibacterium keratini]|uniref:ABC-type quaternary amine transporter n=1 Tax=Epidermidibacterium keratini TaxID=1891644 RepID=A0A7M3T544_9ACTN|nr:betaine/proline/choline family ABC transporter ATP-binding protein [Epidermidibacterium keratini]QHB98910.1 betaine/proline/choline family ABC transporter ATP-binding protein [Epidermidibacterium keratini]